MPITYSELTTKERIRYHEQRSRWHAQMAQLFVKKLKFAAGRHIPDDADVSDTLATMPGRQLTPRQIRNIMEEEDAN